MKIRFFYKDTNTEVENPEDHFINFNGEVWCDNYKTYESQCSVVNLENFLIDCPNVDWKVVTQ